MTKERGSLQIMFWQWWYREATASLWHYLIRFGQYLADVFSAKICILTLFHVWRRDQLSLENLSVKEAFNAWMMNNTSRLVGFVVKFFVLLSFAAVFLLYFFVSLTILAFYLLFPLIILSLVVAGILYIVGDIPKGAL